AGAPPTANAAAVSPAPDLETAIALEKARITAEAARSAAGAVRTELRDRTNGRMIPLEKEEAVLSEPSVAAPLRLLGLLTAGTLYLIGIMLLIAARRFHGAAHLLRGVSGVACIIGAMFLLHGSVSGGNFWTVTAGAPLQQLADEAMRLLNTPPVYLAGATFVTALILLAWPPRRIVAPVPAVAPAEPS
ncbi:MAG: hypothetical protein NZ561_03735, partial [Phycisphaerae bacterium]|nr:hypothetical protein [Phycisphaerae bacterium]